MSKLHKNDTWDDSDGKDQPLPTINQTGVKNKRKITTNHHFKITVEQIAFTPDTYIVTMADETEYTLTEGADGVLEVTSNYSETQTLSSRTTTQVAINAVEQFRRLLRK